MAPSKTTYMFNYHYQSLKLTTKIAVFLLFFSMTCSNIQAQIGKPQTKPGNKAVNQKSKPAINNSKGSLPASNSRVSNNGNKINSGNIKSEGNKVSNVGNKTNNIGSGNKKTNIGSGNNSNNTNIKTGNKVNIDNSKNNNININVNNSTHINNGYPRKSYRPYTRPPYRYGGMNFYCHFGYSYHPYRPFYWGPVWHPWGFFITAMAATAIIISIENQQYHYDQGVYYVASNGGYTVVQAPVGATITTLPPNTQTVVVNETVNNYYYGGTYYEKSDKGYTVVPPTAGTIVEQLPEGAKEEKIGDQIFMKLGEVYYQPIKKDGKDMYEVVNVEKDDSK
ncbi:MAG: hypothetical protein CFE25_10935 [Chitinophagaceae bacterium BSSC1]|nr:MAG: hypothetical protein CFE25_10935 [Chitinophagaceae bacterium BSSC1]